MDRSPSAPAIAMASLVLLCAGACDPQRPKPDEPKAAEVEPQGGQGSSEEKPACHIVFDAGSSGTRLYIYEEQGATGWGLHEGPKVGPLATPVRKPNQEGWPTGADNVAQAIARSLEDIRSPDPAPKDGKAHWDAFDWPGSCRVVSASVLATAGMRLAERYSPHRSAELYEKVAFHLAKVLDKHGVKVSVEARTLTGFEEGLYAWLAIPAEDGDREKLAIAEMGGASSQIAFACPDCSNTEAHRVQLKGETFKFFSYSFLGLGADEAALRFGGLAAESDCAYNAGANKKWSEAKCEDRMKLSDARGIIDPFNGPDEQGLRVQLPLDRFDPEGQWRLTGSFKYWKKIEMCCKDDEEDEGCVYNRKTSCFRALYMPEYLEQIGLPGQLEAPSSEAEDPNWTRGAVVCRSEDCLSKLEAPLPRRWRPSACVEAPPEPK